MMESVPPAIFIQNHQGLGDMIVANAIFRRFAKDHSLIIPCKRHNLPSVQWMLRGLPVAFLAIDNDEQAIKFATIAERRCQRVLRLGMFADGPFDEKQWDREFYRVAGIPFEKRWNEWKIERDEEREFKPTRQRYAFIHEDRERGFGIDPNRLPDMPWDFAEPGWSDNIFDWCKAIEEAEEIHCIDSCFAILADSLTTLKARRKVIHLYARPGALPPTYQPGWEILK